MARSVLAMYSYDEHAEDNSLPNILRQSINLIAELPTMMVNAYHLIISWLPTSGFHASMLTW